MRELFRRFGSDRARVVEAYAEAERRGEVERARDSRQMSADEYASRLFADGVEKKWIQPSCIRLPSYPSGGLGLVVVILLVLVLLGRI